MSVPRHAVSMCLYVVLVLVTPAVSPRVQYLLHFNTSVPVLCGSGSFTVYSCPSFFCLFTVSLPCDHGDTDGVALSGFKNTISFARHRSSGEVQVR